MKCFIQTNALHSILIVQYHNLWKHSLMKVICFSFTLNLITTIIDRLKNNST